MSFPRSKRLPLSLLIASAFSGFHALPSHAQQTSPTRLGEILVSAPVDRPLPANTATVSATSIATNRAASSDTASLLRDVPGMSLQGAGGVSSLPIIHGLADDRVRTKVDGMDLISACPNHMNPALSYLDPGNVGVLKVYAGISPVSVGGDSIAGTIVAETPLPEFAAAGQAALVKGEIGTFYRSNSNARGANLAATYATETLNVSYSGATAEADNYKAARDFKRSTVSGVAGHALALDEVGSTAYKTRNHTLGVAMKSANHLVEAKFGLQDMPYQLYPNQRMDLTGNTQHRVNLRYIGRFDWGTLEARAYQEKVDHLMDFGADKRYWYGSLSGTGAVGAPCAPTGPTCASGMPMNTASKTTGSSLKASIALSEQDLLRVGGEWQRYRLNDWWPASGGGMSPYAFINVNNGQRDRLGIYGEWEKQYNAQWNSLLGIRAEQVKSNADPVHGYNRATAPMSSMGGGMDMMNQTRDAVAFNNAQRDKTDHNWDLAAIARYTADATQDMEFGIARKVRSPNLYERYSWSSAAMMATMNNFVGDGNGYIGNINLKPEVAHTVSATFDWHSTDRTLELRATPYYTRVADYVDAIKVGTFANNKFNVLAFANQSARLVGLDLSGHMPLAKTAYGELGLKGVLSYVNGTNRDTGDELYNIMPLNAKLTLTHKLGGWDNSLELQGVQRKNAVSDVRNEIPTAGYSLLHLRASYTWEKIRVDFGIENLLNRQYALPLGGAYMGQGRTMSLNPVNDPMAWGTAVPGIGRSLYAGVNVKF